MKPTFIKSNRLLLYSITIAAGSFTTILSAAYVSEKVFDWIREETGFESREVRKILGFWAKREKKNVPAWRKQYGTVISYIVDNDLKVGCEVGVAFGTQSVALLKHENITKLYSIDPYIAYKDPFSSGVSNHHWDVLSKVVESRLAPFGDRSIFIRKTSQQALQEFEDGSLDFVYLDGDHSYASVKRDLVGWFKKIRSGGLLLGDDYTRRFPGVRKAVNEFVTRHGLKMTVERNHTYIIRVP